MVCATAVSAEQSLRIWERITAAQSLPAPGRPDNPALDAWFEGDSPRPLSRLALVCYPTNTVVLGASALSVVD